MDNVYIIFVLNGGLKRNEKVEEFLENKGIENANIVTYQAGSVFDLIHGEPTIWIVGQNGNIIYKHIGFQQGDEKLYEKEVNKLIEYSGI